MKSRLAIAGILALFLTPLPLQAQRGFDEEYDWFAGRLKIKGHHIFDKSTFGIEKGSFEAPKSGFGVGLEYVLENGWGFGLTGYTSGRVSDFDSENALVVILAEANYFLRIPALRLAPYLGVHTGLGTYRKGASDFPALRDNITELGYQVGVRFQPWIYLGFDAQVRWMSDAAARDQGDAFERTQVLLGITIL
ncbi:MAG TPA: hypothetical protein VF158_13660 [Longimicrobiales bacterium]